MGSSAQNSSGAHWSRSRIRFNEVPEKGPKVPEKVWDAFVQSQVTFNRVLEKVPEKVPENVWETLVLSHVRFNRFPEKVPEKVLGSLGAKRSQAQQSSREGSGEGLGGFGVEPGQVQQASGEGSEEGSRKPWCKAKSSSTGFRRRFRRRMGRFWCRAT